MSITTRLPLLCVAVLAFPASFLRISNAGLLFKPKKKSVMALVLRPWLSLTALLLFFSPFLTEAALAAAITVTPTQGPPGTVVTVKGTAWPPGDLIEFSWDFNYQLTVASVKADATGAITAIITVPQDAPIGVTYVDAGDQAAFLTAQASFTVTQPITLTIQSVYVTDSAQTTKTAFNSGDGINYHIDATNSSGQALSVFVTFSAAMTGTLGKPIIIDKTFNVNMPTGPSRFYTPSTVPAGAISGKYKLRGSIKSPTITSTSVSNDFSVAHVAAYPLNVPLYSQFWGNENPNSYHEDCGPTSVAMAINYYMDWYDTPAERIGNVRGIIAQGPTKNSTQGTNASELEFALSSIDQTAYSEILWLDQNKNHVPFSSVVSQIQTATGQGYPVVAFVDGTALGRGPNYGGHWFVITGISGDGQTVYVNDPDSDFAGGSGSEGGGPNFHSITLTISDYQNVATRVGARNQNQPYGIIVKGPTNLTPP